MEPCKQLLEMFENPEYVSIQEQLATMSRTYDN